MTVQTHWFSDTEESENEWIATPGAPSRREGKSEMVWLKESVILGNGAGESLKEEMEESHQDVMLRSRFHSVK